MGIPPLLLKPIPVDNPPSVNDLLSAKKDPVNANINNDWEARYNLLLMHYMNQTKNVGICNRQLDNITLWNTQYEPSGKINLFGGTPNR